MELGEKQETPTRKSTRINRLSTLLFVGIFAYFGVAVRLILSEFSKNANNGNLFKSSGSFILPNIFGSFALGVLDRSFFDYFQHESIHKGLTSGFCGSCTTFASWQLISALHILNADWWAAIILLGVTFSTSYMAAIAGGLIGELFAKKMSKKEAVSDKANKKQDGRILFFAAFLSIILTMAIWTLILCDSNNKRISNWTAVALGPIGAEVRYLLSLGNMHHPDLPLFTLIANLSGSIGNAALLVTTSHFGPLLNDYQLMLVNHWLINGLSVGLIGSLSTVSTWIVEIWRLAQCRKFRQAFVYAFVSIFGAQTACLAVGFTYIFVSGQKLSIAEGQ